MTPKEGLARIPWNVGKHPILATGIDGAHIEIPDKVALIREDTGLVLNVVGSGYEIVQNHEQAEFLEVLCGESGAVVECVGALWGGRQTFWTCKLTETFMVANVSKIMGVKDLINQYLILSNPHDGSGSYRLIESKIRALCHNTLTAALRGARGTGFTLRHTSGIKARIEEAKRAVGYAKEQAKIAQDQYQVLAETKIDGAGYDALLRDVFPDAEKDEDGKVRDRAQANVIESRATCLNNLREECKALQTGKELPSLWTAYNSISYYASHQIKTGGILKSANEAASRKVDSVLFGKGMEINRRGIDACLAIADGRHAKLAKELGVAGN